MRKNLGTVVGFLFCWLLASSSLFAEPMSRDQVPDPLRPWVDWVLKDAERCPYLDGSEDSRICRWSSQLRLALAEHGGTFDQQWRIYADSWAPLPGNEEQWPQEVKVDGAPAAVVMMEEHPQVFLRRGEHTVSGAFLWDSTPESFQIPAETGAIQLTVNGVAFPFPSIDENGLVWIHGKEEQEEQAEDSLEVRVHRHMADTVPFVLTTHISLDVSGKTREVLLGPAVLADFVPVSFDCPLPANVQPDGFVRVQVRAGHWELKLSARHKGPVPSLTLPARESSPHADAAWPSEEVWVFEAHTDLRLVSVEGPQALDPQQTTLPDEWKTLPAYRMTPGETIRFSEQRRGDSSPAPDQLNLNRNFWLDFDGSGYTINDQITGTLSASHRLDMNAPVKLGRVSVNGDNQLITKLPGQPQEGFEIRHGQVDIVADSRIEDAAYSAPAIGWDHSFQRVAGILHLPPGYKLFAVMGADHVPSTWINRWSLLQIFLVLVLTLAFARMWGFRWGVIAFFTFALSFPETDSPQWIWLTVLAAIVLLRLIHKGKLLLLLRTFRLIALLILVGICIPFLVQQARLALYPSLEYTSQINTSQSMSSMELQQQIQQMNSTYAYSSDESGMLRSLGYIGGAKEAAPAAPAPTTVPEPQQEAVQEQNAPPRKMAMAAEPKSVSNLNYSQLNPRAMVQTGPGLPRWIGQTVPLRWTGPVEKNQMLRFLLIPPALNLVLSLLRILLIALLVLRVLGLPEDFWPSFRKPEAVPDAALILLILTGLLLLSVPAASAADFPSPEMLKELQERLTENPDCYPSCASISRMQISAAGNTLRIRLEAGAQDQTAVPLPGSASDWTPQQVLVDGEKFAQLYRDDAGTIWVMIGPGGHQVVMEGALPNKPAIQIPLPMKPHHVEATLQGWRLDGLHEDGIVDGNLQLSRLESSRAAGEKEDTELRSGSLPPFVIVKRRLVLGLNWEMETVVTRMTPSMTPVLLDLPLLEGESVTTPGMRIQAGKVQVSMPPQIEEVQWHSVLKETKTINLQAADSFAWAEVWQLDASPLWHVTLEGIPVIHQQSEEGTWLPEWHPWPGEKVSIGILRPEGVGGQTVTLDQSVLSVTPGLRYTEAQLSFNLRSSLGGQHVITLPPGAELQSVSINGTAQPLRMTEQKLSIPLVPGEQKIDLTWQQPGGLSAYFKTPAVNLGLQGVNAEVQMHLPADRWIFFAGGPAVGPAVLFWPFLFVLVLAALGLGKVQLTPLKTLHWLLLGLGLSQLPVWASLILAGWFLVLGWRQARPLENKFLFDLLQLTFVPWTIAALVIVFVSIKQGLLGVPDMQIEGNDSSASLLRWFQDRSAETLPQPWLVSLPLYFYRIAMLAWALWLALALIRWLKWAWQCYSSATLWKRLRKKKATPPPMPSAPPAETPQPSPDTNGSVSAGE